MNPDWVRVSLSVPTHLYGDFLEVAGQFLNDRITNDQPATDEPATETIAWLEADYADDLESAVHVYGLLSPRGRGLFDLLMDNPDKRFAGDELADILSIPNGRYGTAGTLAWPGRHAQAVGRKLPVTWDRETHAYWMTKEVASLFREARDAHTEAQ
jgi:hypothetical protein